MPRRHLDELVDTIDPAWLLVQGWLAQARNPVEILPAERQRGERTLLQLQVTSHSTLGALALETGGAFFDHGWLRFPGSGCERMQVNLLNCNPATRRLTQSAPSSSADP